MPAAAAVLGLGGAARSEGFLMAIDCFDEVCRRRVSAAGEDVAYTLAKDAVLAQSFVLCIRERGHS